MVSVIYHRTHGNGSNIPKFMIFWGFCFVSVLKDLYVELKFGPGLKTVQNLRSCQNWARLKISDVFCNLLMPVFSVDLNPVSCGLYFGLD